MAYTLDGEKLAWKTTYTIDKDQIDSDLSDKDTYIILDSLGSDFWDNVKSTGGDIRAAINGIRIPLEVSKTFSTVTDTGFIVVKPSLTSSSVDTVVEIYWGNPTLVQPPEDEPYGSHNVYVGYVLVAHLEEDNDDETDFYNDSTSYHNTGLAGGPFQVPAIATGKVGKAQRFDQSGSADVITFGSDSSLRPTDFSIECLINTNLTQVQIIADTQDSGNFEGFVFYLDPTNKLVMVADLDGVTPWDIDLISDGVLSPHTWYHIGFSFTSGSQKLFVDGVEQADSQTTAGSINWVARDLEIGGGNQVWAFDGEIDEFAYSNVFRNAAWYKASSVNKKTPLTYGTFGALVQDTFLSKATIF
jgi:hypothetical protein